MTETCVVHLLRHGEVHNPHGITYGRLPGYHLSAAGQGMAEAAAGFLAGRDVRLLLTSPLERARETAAPVAAGLGVPAEVDERLIEPWSHFEGQRFGVGDGAIWRPAHWRHLVNPFRPSWGEPYDDIAGRMRSVIADAAKVAAGHEAVLVSHQLAIWVARRAAERRRLWHHPARRQCSLASVTSLTVAGDQILAVDYAEPAGHIDPAVRHNGMRYYRL